MHQLKSNWGSVLICELSPVAYAKIRTLKTVSTSAGISKYWVVRMLVNECTYLPIPIILY